MFDEPESGVDLENISLIGNVDQPIASARLQAQCSERARRELHEERTKMGLIITHTGFILDYVTADKGQVLLRGS